MSQYTIELADTYKITRGGVTCEVETAKLSPMILGNCVFAGLQTKVGDAASGAVGQAYSEESTKHEGWATWDNLNADEKSGFKESHERAHQKIALGNMAEVLKGLESDHWGSTRSGSGLDPEIAIMLNATLRVSTGKSVWGKMKAEDQRTASLAMWESLDEETQAKWNIVATARKEVKEDQRKALAEIAMPELEV